MGKMTIAIRKPDQVCDECWETAKVTIAGILVPEHCRSKVRCVYSLVKYQTEAPGYFSFVLEQEQT